MIRFFKMNVFSKSVLLFPNRVKDGRVQDGIGRSSPLLAVRYNSSHVTLREGYSAYDTFSGSQGVMVRSQFTLIMSDTPTIGKAIR